MADLQIALIRGVNVGRAKRVAMADLRALVQDLGYREVRTVLNSGNVVFAVPDTAAVNSAARLEEALSTRLGISAKVMVLTAAELTTIVADNPLGERAEHPSRLLVAVLGSPADRARVKPLEQQDWTPEVLAIGTRAAYLWCPDGISESRLAKAVGDALGGAVTTRNWATVMKLHTLIANQGRW